MVERAYYRGAGPAITPLREPIRVAAGTRWAIEECVQPAKNDAALDHYQFSPTSSSPNPPDWIDA